MAAFASCRRSGWVRVLVVILCAFFIFATLGAPSAQALGVESVAVFGLASVLSAATAALGFKLASNEQGQATLQKMVQDFKTVAWATGFILVGSKLNGLQNGMDYIKMQVKNGKTYLDSRVFAWVQQWLAENGVYDTGTISINTNYPLDGSSVSFVGCSYEQAVAAFSTICDYASVMDSVIRKSSYLNDVLSSSYFRFWYNSNNWCGLDYGSAPSSGKMSYYNYSDSSVGYFVILNQSYDYDYLQIEGTSIYRHGTTSASRLAVRSTVGDGDGSWNSSKYIFSNYFGVDSSSSNNTGLSGTDTLGKDVIDLTLDQILQKLKDWAQDWYDAGADSATNAATGAKDLPLTVATGAATANPSIAEDGPLVWFPSFGLPIPSLRTGETDTKTVDQGKENASAAETSTVDVAENQSVLDSLVNWALGYISPDTGIFSKFPLCVPYDAYLLVTSSLGVDAVGSDSIFGASPGDLDGVVTEGIETYSDFQPIINIKHDFELDGVTYPLELVIDLRPWQPLVTFFREGMALLLVAELIGAEYKRIRWH